MLEIFNKRMEDFESLEDYDKHLEMVEDIVQCLLNINSTDEQRE